MGALTGANLTALDGQDRTGTHTTVWFVIFAPRIGVHQELHAQRGPRPGGGGADRHLGKIGLGYATALGHRLTLSLWRVQNLVKQRKIVTRSTTESIY